MKILENKTNEDIYLEWLNDFISVERIAESYNVERYEIQIMINKGRDEHLQKFESEAYKNIWLTKN